MTNNSPSLDEITNFLYHEADLLDQNNLEEWINLYTEDGTYWMPVAIGQADPLNHISIFYDDKAMMQIRKHNLDHKRAPSKEIDFRSSHIIGNVRIINQDAQSGEYRVKSNFQSIVYYGTQTLFAGTCHHDLVKQQDTYLIRQKKVELINCDASHSTIISYI